MSAGPGYITRETLSQIESVIDRDGLLGQNEPETSNQRTNAEPANPLVTPEETPPPGDAEIPIGEPPGDDTPLAAEGGEGGEDADPSASPIAEPGDITSIAALAAEFETDEEGFLSSINVDNGMGYQISLGAALNDWRETSTNLLARQEQHEAEFQSKLGEINGRADEELKKMGTLASVLATELNSDFNGVDIEDLKIREPAVYADMIEKRHRRQELIKQTLEQFDLNSGDRGNQSTADLDRIKQREATQLAQKMPHWAKDREVAKQVVNENTALMRGLGFTDEDIAGVIDHRQILVLHWAAQYRKSISKTKGKTLEKLREKKGLRRPGMVNRATARIDQGDPKTTERKARTGALRKSANTGDAARLIETFL